MKKLYVRPFPAGFSRVMVRKREQGFCVKAARKPVGCYRPQPVWASLPGVRPSERNIRAIINWSSSQNNNRNILYRKLASFIDGRYHVNDTELIKSLCRKIIFNDPTGNCKYRSPRGLWELLPRDKSLFTYLGIMKHYKTWRQRRYIIQNNISPFWYKHIALASQSYGKIIKKGGKNKTKEKL